MTTGTDTSITPEMLDDLFDLSPQLEPAERLPAGMGGSDECTSDGCTASCVGC
ncbi:hypothetical protein [Actinocorallia longicatena]|uniref:FxLD family lantipeptide n=1 Tax=Actinocorallia longicatena TaxID=111803 RepID=A0ABP6QNL4_9ACTN